MKTDKGEDNAFGEGKKELEEIIVGVRNKVRRTDVEKRVRGSTSERGKEKQQFFPITTKLIPMYCISGCEQLYVKLWCTVPAGRI
jgi:hypothetical protein